MPRTPLTLAALLAALALAACGSNSASDEEAVKQTVNDFYNALGDKDAKKACDAISEKGRESIEKSLSRNGKKQSCSQVFGIILTFSGNSLKQAKDVKVEDVKIDGDKARATVSLAGRRNPVGLVKEDGEWKLGGLNLSNR